MATPTIREIIDDKVAEASAQRSDAMGIMARCVLEALDSDGEFQKYAKALLNNYPWATRREKITTLAKVFGADRDQLRTYLRAHSLCGPKD